MDDIKIIIDSSDAIKAAKNVDSLDNSVSDLGRTSQTSGKIVDKSIRGVNQFGSVAKNGGKKLNTFNMQIQQGGYQLQDFVVQLQGGTSFFTAFGQQGSQFAGVFGPQGAVIGAIIAIGSAVGGMAYKMLSSANEIKGFQEAIEETSSALENLSDSIDLAAMSTKELQESFGGAAGTMKGALAILRDIAKNEAQEKIDGLSKSLASLYKISGGGDRRADISKLFDVDIFFAFTREAKAARKVARGLTAEFVNAQTALLEGEGNIDAQIKATERLLAVTQTLADASGGRSKEEEDLIKKFSEALVQMGKIKAAQEGITEQSKIAAELEKNRLESIDAEKKSMGDTIALNQEILTYGKDSLEVRTLEAKQARDKYELDQKSKKILGDSLIDVMNLYDINVALTDQQKRQAEYQNTINGLQAQNQVFVNSLNEASDEARKKAEKQVKLVAQLEEKYGEALVTALALSGVDVSASMSAFIDKALKAQSDLEGLGETYGTQLAKVNAQIKALEEGKDAEVAAFVAGERAKITALYASSKAFAMKTKDIIALANASLAFLAAMGELDALAAAKTKLSSMETAGGGSSSNVIDINEIIEARKLQVEQDRVLIGLSGEQHEAQRIYYELLKENEKADVQVTETKLKNSADYIAAKLEENRVLEEATAQQNDLAQSIADSMGDAFTSIVDGTKSVKDAFKDMARSIIKQLFEVLVVQRLVGSVGVGDKAGSGLAGWLSGTLQADGGAWQGGSQIQAYANGGVVGGPTMFPMAGGKTGLMGEAGPEAIMPLKRGANGKLGVQMEGGGGDNVVIHQNFNFQANGDESVKKLIAQAAPQIANMTKSSMLNDRRRGGTTKAVFG